MNSAPGVLAWMVSAAVAFIVSAVMVRLMEQHAGRWRLVDLPNARSSHAIPRPRGGGIGIVAGVAAGIAVATASGLPTSAPMWMCLLATLLLAAVGFLDDLTQMPVTPRLLAQTVVASGLVILLGGFTTLPLPAPVNVSLGWVGPPLAVLWILAVLNFFNFMDGADGLAGGQAVLSLAVAGAALLPYAAAVPALLGAAATAAFLLRNWAPARIFLGDVGSSCLGALLAVLPFAAPVDDRERLALLVGTSLALFLLDPVATLLVRTVKGRPIGRAHREHAYQRLLVPGRSHGPVVRALLSAGLVLSLLAATAYWNDRLGWWVLAGVLAFFIFEWRLAGERAPRTNEERFAD